VMAASAERMTGAFMLSFERAENKDEN
jgi:hypothetical protein